MTNIFTKTFELEDVLVTIIGDMEQQNKVTSAATSQTHVRNKSDIKNCL